MVAQIESANPPKLNDHYSIEQATEILGCTPVVAAPELYAALSRVSGGEHG